MLTRDAQTIPEIDLTDEAADEEAVAEYLAKGGISHEAVMAWVDSWGTTKELPAPQIGD